MKNNQIVIYATKNNKTRLEVKLEAETVWLTRDQIADLFEVQRPAVSKHVINIYKSQELNKKATSSKMELVREENNRIVSREIDHYNLDMIISIGYRVNSKKATQFRIWATNTLREHLVKGYTLNSARLHENGIQELQEAFELIKSTISNKRLSNKESIGLLNIITEYTDSWILFQKYDNLEIQKPKGVRKASKNITYDQAVKIIQSFKKQLRKDSILEEMFGIERGESLQGILKTINQTFDRKELYPSLEEKASHLLYFLIKDHPFVDGNKRIGTLLFLQFLNINGINTNKNGLYQFSNNEIVAITLLIAQSDAKHKGVMIKLIMNFLSKDK